MSRARREKRLSRRLAKSRNCYSAPLIKEVINLIFDIENLTSNIVKRRIVYSLGNIWWLPFFYLFLSLY